MLKISLIIITTALLLSCTTLRKFDYKSAYKFKYLKYEKLSEGDSLPVFLVSSEWKPIHQGRLNLNHFKFQENAAMFKKKTVPMTSSMIRSEIKYSNSKINYGKDLTVFTGNKAPKEVKKNKSIKATKHTSGFHDLHPALQGFLFVVLGFGVVLVGALLGNIPVFPTILIIAGFVVAAIGFYIIATQI